MAQSLKTVIKTKNMKYITLIFLSLFLSCKSTKKMEGNRTIEASKNELIVVLKNPNKVDDAKALITNSGLKWDQLLFDQKDLKIALIKVPEEKRDFWLKRLQQSGTFSSVELNQKGNFLNIKNQAENTFVKIRKTACFGRCPVYEFTIFKDGTALFDGLQYVNKTGKHKLKLNKDEFTKLQELLSKTAFYKYKDSYNNPRITDLPSVYITHQGKQVQIRIWENVPDELKTAEKYIEQLVKDHNFTK